MFSEFCNLLGVWTWDFDVNAQATRWVINPCDRGYVWPQRVLIIAYGVHRGDEVWEVVKEKINFEGFCWETRLNQILNNEKHLWQQLEFMTN